jgi:tRNA dimethylallyltransferase
MKCLIAIVGPTAVGKSKLAVQLASNFGMEIISADSRQVYRYMDIGTGKPTLEERKLVPHHLIDVVNPDDDFSVANYVHRAYEAIEGIQQRGKSPLLVGGSGLYVWAVIEGWKLPNVPPDRNFRQRLEIKAKKQGSYALYQQLRKIDPVAAAKIDSCNTRRVIRALEIYHSSRHLPSSIERKHAPDFPILVIGLTTGRSELYRRIDRRVDEMMNKGLVEEVKGLMQREYSLSLPSMSGIGYKQVGDFLLGKMELSETIERIKYKTHCLARHQYAWFHPNDARIHWLDVDDAREKAKDLIQGFLS